MTLSADQRATLELLLGRGQTYADLSQLLDASEAEVRERARSALEEIGGADPDRNVELTDYLLGQADPISRADVVRHLREDGADHRLATELAAKLKQLVPDADLPRLPGEPRAGRFLRRDPSGEPAGGGEAAASRLSPSQARLLVALGAGAVLLVAIVLAVTGAFGGDGGGVASPTPGEAADEEVTRVALSPPDGGRAGGEAVFGLTGADTVYVDLDIAGLEQPAEDESYVLWLLLNRNQGWPLSPLPIGPNGVFRERLAIPTGLLPLVAQVRFVEVALAGNQELADLIEAAPDQVAEGQDLDDFLLDLTGRTVLQGTIPVEEAPPGAEEDATPPEGEDEAP